MWAAEERMRIYNSANSGFLLLNALVLFVSARGEATTISTIKFKVIVVCAGQLAWWFV